jgi:glycosyltransferase involved in cell wall biosynthesis
MPPRVNIAVCGNQGQLQLVPHLRQLVDLGKVYYASRLTANARHFGLRPDQTCNIFVKEYLAQFHARYLHDIYAAEFYPIYDRIWQHLVLKRWQPCDVLHLVAQGKALEILRRSKYEDSAILGHVVTSHPTIFQEEVEKEHAFLGVSSTRVEEQEQATIEEIGLCDRIFCLSGLIRDSLTGFGYPAERIDVIPMHFTPQYFQPGDAPSQENFRILCVARICPIKGHVYLLEAWRKLALPNAELILVGTLQRNMRPILHRYDGLFSYHGPVDGVTLAKLYQQASVLVLPSVQDGFGLVVSEALACGTPVIITSNVGARDIVEHDVNGLIVPPRNVDALAAAITRIYESHELRRHLRAGALRAREKYPTVSGVAAKLCGIYSQLYQQSKGRPITSTESVALSGNIR